MKRIAALSLIAALLLSCAACSQGSDKTPAPTETPVPEVTETPEATAAPEVEPVAAEDLVVDDVPVHVTSEDGLVNLDLPNQRWAELHSDEHTILFSNGDCAITIDLLKKGDTTPTVPFSDETHKLIFTSSVSAEDYVLFVTGYAREETDFTAISTAINSIRIDRTKVPQTAQPQPSHSYTVQDQNYSAWVTAAGLNVRSASGTDAKVLTTLTKDTQVTVTGEVLEDGKYIGWSRVKLANGSTGYVASQFLTKTQPKPAVTKTGTTKNLWSQYGTVYTLYEYTDNTWKTSDNTVYWAYGFSTWINSAGNILYDYDPTAAATTTSATGNSRQLWDAYGLTCWVYEYSDYSWKDSNGTSYRPDGFSTWKSSTGKILYDYDPTEGQAVAETATPPDNWKSDFEVSLFAHDNMVVCWYTYLGDGYYEATCQDASDPSKTGTVVVNAYDGSWKWN